MPWKRRKPKEPRVAQSADVARTTTSGSEIPAALKSIVQDAAELAKRELSDAGRITPKAVFVYDETTPGSGAKSIVVGLSNRGEAQEDALRKRIKEKAVQEGARAVVVMQDTKPGTLSVSGYTAEVRVFASVSYSYDRTTKTVNRWEMQWRTGP